jgi:chloramphenicol 3-O phosphotransferase
LQRHDWSVAPTAIVLNGATGAGKSTIAAGLQSAWPRPLQVSGIDTFLGMQSQHFFTIDGPVGDGFSWVPSVVGGQAAFDVIPGHLGVGMINAIHAYWAATVEAGLDPVLDDVWLIGHQPTNLARALSNAHVVWVGVRCTLDVLEHRERDRDDRRVGTARGQHALVHSFRSYDIELDTSVMSPQECVAAILAYISNAPS